MRIRKLGVAALAVVVTAGLVAAPAAVAAAVAPAHTFGGNSHTFAGKKHTFAGNKAKARIEARRLLRVAGVPTGSTRLSARPKGLSGPVAGAPAGKRIELTRYYRVPLGSAAARRWIRHHRPHGLHADGSGSVGRNGRTILFGYEFDASRHTMAWADASLQYTVHVGRRHTNWRIDAIVLPYDPRPLRAARSRRGFSVRTSCPARDRDAGHVGRRVSGPGHALVPRGRVAGALVCGYSGLDPQSGKRFARVVDRSLGTSKARKLRMLARRVSLSHLDEGAIPCPMDDGSVVVLALHYAGGRTVDLWYQPTGCGYVANGTVLANGTAPRGYGRLVTELDRVARVSKWAWPTD